MLQCVVDRVEALAIGDALEVVEHDGERRAERRHAVHQFDHRALDAAGDLEPLQRPATEAVAHAVDRHCRVRPEPHRIVVAGIERHPGHRPGPALVPGARGHRLPVSRGGRDECEHHVVPCESRLDARASDHLGAKPRQQELRLGERERLVFCASCHFSLRPRLENYRHDGSGGVPSPGKGDLRVNVR